MNNINKHINIGIVAHVDAGKTSITEQMLFKCGVIKSIGSVDKGTSQTDWLKVERERGITVRSASAPFIHNNININIIDTPGHVDFSSEVERSFTAMDCVILIISAVEGVQGHTEALWDAIRKINIPCIIFINKIDRQGADIESVLVEIEKELTPSYFSLQYVEGEGSEVLQVSNIIIDQNHKPNDFFIESIVNNDDLLLEKYLNGDNIAISEIRESLKRQIRESTITPLLYGSAKFDVGVKELLDFITEYMPISEGDSKGDLSGIVYKVDHSKKDGRIASVRLFSGSIKNRDIILLNGEEHKVTQIKKQIGNKFYDTGTLMAGDIAAVFGFSNVRGGDIIGSNNNSISEIELVVPMLILSVSPSNEQDYSMLVEAMHILSDEDPKIQLEWLQDERKLHISIVGLIQLEILQATLLDRFGIEVTFGKPTVIYKETPAAPTIAHEEYTMPKPCWAVVRFKVEPADRGSGVIFTSNVGVNDIAARYQQEVERTIPLALKQGPLGWEVTDLKITLIGDEDHNVHSRAGDFAVATPMAIMKGLQSTGTILLEPILAYTIKAQEDKLGSVVSSLTQLRAEIGIPEINNDNFILRGTIPVATSLDYPTKIASLTGGKGKYSTKLLGYRECPVELGETTAFRGINPLDRSKYILKARKALS